MPHCDVWFFAIWALVMGGFLGFALGYFSAETDTRRPKKGSKTDAG
jgi:membrane protein YqaA with SNARE-associated domain